MVRMKHLELILGQPAPTYEVAEQNWEFKMKNDPEQYSTGLKTAATYEEADMNVPRCWDTLWVTYGCM